MLQMFGEVYCSHSWKGCQLESYSTYMYPSVLLLSYLHMKGIEDKTGCNQTHYTTCYSNMYTHSFNAPLVSWFPRTGTTIDKGTTLDFTNKILHGRVYVVLTTKQININKFFLIPTKPVCRLRQTKPAHLYRNQRKITGWIETGKKQRMMVQGRLLLYIYISVLTLRWRSYPKSFSTYQYGS